MHLSCDLMDLLIELKKSMLKLLNELSAVSPVHIQFFTLFSCSSSLTFGQLSMNLYNGSPRLEIQSLIVYINKQCIVYATVSLPRHQQKVRNLIPGQRRRPRLGCPVHLTAIYFGNRNSSTSLWLPDALSLVYGRGCVGLSGHPGSPQRERQKTFERPQKTTESDIFFLNIPTP